MLKLIWSKIYRRKRVRSPLILILLLLLWSLVMGWGMALALDITQLPPASGEVPQRPLVTDTSSIGTVDPVPSSYELGQQLYLKNCSSCHLAIPPAVLPAESWRQLLQNEQHYGIQLPRITSPSIVIVWNYLRTFSRSQLEKEALPSRVADSRYFKALHPKVDLPPRVESATCITCHPSATEFNFRRLSE